MTAYDTQWKLYDQPDGPAQRLANVLFDGWTFGEIDDLANHSADSGWPGLTYTSDLVEFYAAHHGDLWELWRGYCDDSGDAGPMLLHGEPVNNHGDLATFLVWFAAEILSCRIQAEDDL
jgi:hypothetical protein